MQILTIILGIGLLSSCTSKPRDVVRLDVGTCYHDYGDIGGKPDIIFCVQAAGKDGFLKCQGDPFPNKDQFHWYACNNVESWGWLSLHPEKLRKVECPTPCPVLR